MTRVTAVWVIGAMMRHLRTAESATLTDVAAATNISKSHLSHVELGRDRPSWDVVSYYEEHFHGDGQLWSAYVEMCTAPTRSAIAAASETPYPVPGDVSEFVDDITIPDGTVMPPHFAFEKIWRIQNVGTVPWTGRWLARDGASAGLGIPWSPTRVAIPDTLPGQKVDIAVPLRANPEPGTAQVRWKMVDDDGREFFPTRQQYQTGLILTIVVRVGAPEPKIQRMHCDETEAAESASDPATVHTPTSQNGLQLPVDVRFIGQQAAVDAVLDALAGVVALSRATEQAGRDRDGRVIRYATITAEQVDRGVDVCDY